MALPRGREHTHQIINTSNEVLIYLCISTMIEPDIIEYPDSDKIGTTILDSSSSGGEKNKKSQTFYQKNSAVSYFKDEK